MISDGAYPSLLQGVSQQVLHLRKEGQLTEQVNMLADAVTGLRRRPGTHGRVTLPGVGGSGVGKLHTFYGEYDGTGYHIAVDASTGSVHVYDRNYTLVQTLQSNYLIADDIQRIRVTNVAGYTWLANVDKLPSFGTNIETKRNPDYDGWFHIKLGAFSKRYSVWVRCPGLNKEYQYTTPDGTNSGDATSSTPQFIANAIRNQMTGDADFSSKFDTWIDGSSVFITRATKHPVAGVPTQVTTTAGDIYAQTSMTATAATRDLLPATLPSQANNTMMSVGTLTTAMSYFKWDYSRSLWAEVGDYASKDRLVNMPLRFNIIGNVATLEAPDFEGRLSGDDQNNPYPAFTTYGITGISAYQGRLVLLAGGYVCMSSSNRPLRFMRNSAVDLQVDDAIEISAGSVVNSDFEYAIPFNKDLLLMSKSSQAVIPAGSTGISPMNALVVLSSQTTLDTLAQPTIVGRTLMYSTGVSSEFFGIGEMVPSAYSDSHYTTQNLTDHIPRYIPGRCRSIVSSTSSSLALFLSDESTNVVLVNEYLWVGEERIQNAWYKWEFSNPVLSAHFAQGQVVLTFEREGGWTMCTLDPRSASYQQLSSIPPFLDMYIPITVTDNKFTVPNHLRSLATLDLLHLAHIDGDLSGEPIGIESLNTTTWEGTTVRSFKNGTAAVGILYTSMFSPTPPLYRDDNGVPELTANTNVLRHLVNVRNTGEFKVKVLLDGVGREDLTQDSSAVLWSSSELGLGSKQAVSYGTVIVPIRALSERSLCQCYADSTRELNVISVEYTIRGVRRRKRV